MERGRKLLHRQVNEPQIVQDLPIEGCEIVSPLEARDGRHKLLLPEKAHPDVIPELWRLRELPRGDAVLGQGHVPVVVGLHHGAGGEDGAGVGRVEGHGRAKLLEGELVLPGLHVEEAEGAAELGVLGRTAGKKKNILVPRLRYRERIQFHAAGKNLFSLALAFSIKFSIPIDQIKTFFRFASRMLVRYH